MKIYVVGIGPGGHNQITKRALDAIYNSDIIIGYEKYIELISNIISEKQILSSPMKKEVERCRKALDFALNGKTVCIISSGDAGVYGMAGIMHEICSDYPNINIEVIPGITACCSAAAILGAPIINDFAVISLSDLLTPWEEIKNRIFLASKADFIICLYNPSSKKRADYLKKACSYMLKYKNPNTPCGYVKNIDRNGELHKICSLTQLQNEDVDMFTTIIIGNSQTKVINGKLVTSRGYKNL